MGQQNCNDSFSVAQPYYFIGKQPVELHHPAGLFCSSVCSHHTGPAFPHHRVGGHRKASPDWFFSSPSLYGTGTPQSVLWPAEDSSTTCWCILFLSHVEGYFRAARTLPQPVISGQSLLGQHVVEEQSFAPARY